MAWCLSLMRMENGNGLKTSIAALGPRSGGGGRGETTYFSRETRGYNQSLEFGLSRSAIIFDEVSETTPK